MTACVAAVKDEGTPSPAHGSGTFMGTNYSASTIDDVSPYFASAPPFDPVMVAGSVTTFYPHLGGVAVASGWTPATTSYSTQIVMAFFPTGPERPGSYPLASAVSIGGAIVLYRVPGASCTASSGSLTIASYAPPLGAIGGSFNVTAWDVSSTGTCPTLPATSSFFVARSQDFHYGNDYSGTDTMSISRTGASANFPAAQTFTESAAVPNDPLLTVQYRSSSTPPSTSIQVAAEGNTGLSPPQLSRTIQIQLPGAPAVGTFSVNATTVTFSESKTIGVSSTITCQGAAGGGTVTLTSAGAAGAKVIGTFNITSVVTNPGCPTAYSGSFSITREKDQ
jgi:hypothetical protein